MMNDQQKHLENYCKAVYARTKDLWESLEGRYPTWQCRFSILYGPPRLNPDLMILGSNPGFDPKDLYDEEILTWPASNEYWTRSWPFAVKLREIFAKAGCTEQIKTAVGSNRLFFKSKSLDAHPSGLGWKNNPPEIRRALEDFSRRELAGLIEAINPKAILVLGLGTFDAIADEIYESVHSVSDTPPKRRIFAVGRGLDRKMIGMIHPTGARISKEDLALISQRLAKELDSPLVIQVPRPNSDPMPALDEAKRPQPAAQARPSKPVSSSPATKSRQPPLRPDTLIVAKDRPPGNFGYQPILDFWQQLKRTGPVSVKDFHDHMVSLGWKRPSGKPLTYDVTRTDLASMCKHGFAERF